MIYVIMFSFCVGPFLRCHILPHRSRSAGALTRWCPVSGTVHRYVPASLRWGTRQSSEWKRFLFDSRAEGSKTEAPVV